MDDFGGLDVLFCGWLTPSKEFGRQKSEEKGESVSYESLKCPVVLDDEDRTSAGRCRCCILFEKRSRISRASLYKQSDGEEVTFC